MLGILHVVYPTTIHNNFGFKMWGPPSLIERFHEICWREFRLPGAGYNPEWGTAIWQCDRRSLNNDPNEEDFLYIEFWMGDPEKDGMEAKVLAKAREIAREMNIPVESIPKGRIHDNH